MTREEALSKAIMTLIYFQAHLCKSKEAVENTQAIIDTLERIEQEPKTGHWVLLDECSNAGYYCSECHKKVVKEGWSDTVKKIKYCPNCGAKMESEG